MHSAYANYSNYFNSYLSEIIIAFALFMSHKIEGKNQKNGKQKKTKKKSFCNQSENWNESKCIAWVKNATSYFVKCDFADFLLLVWPLWKGEGLPNQAKPIYYSLIKFFKLIPTIAVFIEQKKKQNLLIGCNAMQNQRIQNSVSNCKKLRLHSPLEFNDTRDLQLHRCHMVLSFQALFKFADMPTDARW